MDVLYCTHYSTAGLQKITEGSQQTSHSLSGFVILDIDLSNLQWLGGETLLSRRLD